MLTASDAIEPQTLYPLIVDYSQYKALQALLFFSLPVIWCVWQLIALRRTSDATVTAGREEGVDPTPATAATDEIG